MSNSFTNAVAQNQIHGTTYNGAPTFTTSTNPVLDLFFAAGNRDVDLAKPFDLAVRSDKKLAYRVLLWSRDIRGGAGERKTFRNILSHLEKHYKQDLLLMLTKIPELGRWDDLLVFNDDEVRNAAFLLIKKALIVDKNGLCAKWMPRKGIKAIQLRTFLDMSPKTYRKTLVELTKVVETQMCAKEWDKIVFDHVPSLASARYQKAFLRHCGQAYSDYRNGLKKTVLPSGEVVEPTRKINAAAVFPYDVIKSIDNGDREIAMSQWDAMPNLLGDDSILPMVDVSGSMTSWSYYAQRNSKVKVNVTPMQIACSIGLYTASKQTGDFNGMFLTFSSRPKIQKLTGDLVSMYSQMVSSHWEMSTNLSAAFQEILAVAVKNNVPQSDMPKILLILSDMEFDACAKNSSVTNFQSAKIEFERAGYQLPRVVFWAINGRSDNSPVKFNETGTALVSGFSPAIFKSILKNDLEDFSPYNVMLQTLNASKYDIARLTV